jgi:hypothetical protein
MPLCDNLLIFRHRNKPTGGLMTEYALSSDPIVVFILFMVGYILLQSKLLDNQINRSGF